MRYHFIQSLSGQYPISVLCQVMRVWRSGYYYWLNKPAKLISEQELKLYRKTKQLFAESHNNLDSRKAVEETAWQGRFSGRSLQGSENNETTEFESHSTPGL